MRDIVSPLDGFASPFGRLRGSAAFSPASLFAASEPGVWYDPSDTSTLFQDTAGTTPVTAPGQTVALALDKSQGLALGPELVDDANTAATWIPFASNTIAQVGDAVEITYVDSTGGAYVVLNAAAGTSENLAVGTFYQISGQVKISTGTANVKIGGNLLPQNTDIFAFSSTSYVDFFAVFQCIGANPNIQFSDMGVGEVVSIRGISVRELPGYHATQANSSFEPQYQTSGLLYDGTDDRLDTTYTPTTSGTIIARFNGDTASRVIAGSQAASDGRCFLALDASGRLGAGIGAQSTSTIFGGADLRAANHVGAVTWDGTTVKLYLDGTEVYSAAQSGAVNTTVAMMHGALNANGTASAFWDGSVSDAIVLNRVMTPTEITKTTNLWSA